MSHCLINGQALNHIDVRSRGLAFGDGIFETCFSHKGQIRFLDEHLSRLKRGIAALQLHWGPVDSEHLMTEIQSIQDLDDGPAAIKVILVRQAGGRGYDFDPQAQSTDRIVMRTPFTVPEWVEAGARLVVSERHASSNPDLVGIKHLNRLDSVLARQDARRHKAHEALMCLPNGYLVEGTMSNVYLRLAGQWVTPELDLAGVDGIIRRQLLQSSDTNLISEHIDKAQLAQADAAMISNSLLGLVPVIELSGRELTVPETDELTFFRHAAGLNDD